MKQHFCPIEQSVLAYQGQCNWCGEKESKQRTWVGLTDADFYGQSELQKLAMKYAEAKLKELNT